MANFGYDEEPRDFTKPVTPQDVIKLSERLTAAGIQAGHVNDVTGRLSRPGNRAIDEGSEAHVFHRTEPPQVHFAIGKMVLDAPAADIEHLVLSAEPAILIILGSNQAYFNKSLADAAQLPGLPSTDTNGAVLQRYTGEAGWLIHDTIAHYIHTIEHSV